MCWEAGHSEASSDLGERGLRGSADVAGGTATFVHREAAILVLGGFQTAAAGSPEIRL